MRRATSPRSETRLPLLLVALVLLFIGVTSRWGMATPRLLSRGVMPFALPDCVIPGPSGDTEPLGGPGRSAVLEVLIAAAVDSSDEVSSMCAELGEVWRRWQIPSRTTATAAFVAIGRIVTFRGSPSATRPTRWRYTRSTGTWVRRPAGSVSPTGTGPG